MISIETLQVHLLSSETLSSTVDIIVHYLQAVGYVPSSSLYPRYSTHSCNILCMVLMRVSGRCTVLMVLLMRAQNNVQYIVVLVQCMVLMVSISTCVQYTIRGLEG